MIREIVAVGIGGALGSMSRYLVSYVWLVEQSLLGFPAGTFTVNAAGSLLMGFLLEILGAGTASWLLSVGFCGGFTTFSSFADDMYLFHLLFRRGADAQKRRLHGGRTLRCT